MAKATITIEDIEQGGTNVSINFDPPIENHDGNGLANATHAQRIAITIGSALRAADPSSEMIVK